MKALYLAQIGRQLFAIDKECVLGIVKCNDASFKPVVEKGRQYLLLPYNNRAVICDVQALMTGSGEAAPARRHYLIIAHNDQVMGLAMSGKGRIVTADVAAVRPLPPAFTGQSRALVPGVLVNGIDLILLLDLQAVLEAIPGPCPGDGCRAQEQR